MTISQIQWNPYTAGDFADDFCSLGKTSDGASDFLEMIANACDWVVHLGINRGIAAEAAQTLDTTKKAFSLFGFFPHLNAMSNEFFSNKEEGPEARLILNEAILATNKATTASLWFHETAIFPLAKKALQSVKSACWSSILVFDAINVFHEIKNVTHLKSKLDTCKNEAQKEMVVARIRLSYLFVVKSVTTVAMAGIALVSILFASLAKGFLFNPAVMLGLTSTWLILNFISYFYEQMIETWEKSPGFLPV